MATTKKSRPIKSNTRTQFPPIIDEQLMLLAENQIMNGEMSLTEAIKLFGFKFGKKDKGKEVNPSFALPQNEDGALTIMSGGIYGTYVDLEGTAKNEVELITRYREAALHPEVDSAIEDIINESIVTDESEPVVQINLDKMPGVKDNFKEIVKAEFQNVLNLLNFEEEGHNIFKRWYIDGRLFYHIIINNDTPQEGIQELRYIDPRRIRKIREQRKKLSENGIEIVDRVDEYYLYNERGINNANTTAVMGVKISEDAISYSHSGLVESGRTHMILSHLHKALKPLNQLRHMEDAVVIYRLSRAPERRIFYIDVGNLPKLKAEQYLRDIMLKYRNKLVYDANTGEVRDDKKFLSMMEDYWLPRREGGRSTEIDTLPGGENLGQITDIEYFEQKLYRALNVPISRIKSEGGFNLGRSAEISRDEVKFFKFVMRVRKRFTHLFFNLLKVQLLLRGVIVEDEWESIKQYIKFIFAQNSYFSELKETEILRERIATLTEMSPFVGVYFSMVHIKRDILKQTDDDIKMMTAEMESEVGVMPQFLATQMQASQIVQMNQAALQQQSRMPLAQEEQP